MPFVDYPLMLPFERYITGLMEDRIRMSENCIIPAQAGEANGKLPDTASHGSDGKVPMGMPPKLRYED